MERKESEEILAKLNKLSANDLSEILGEISRSMKGSDKVNPATVGFIKQRLGKMSPEQLNSLVDSSKINQNTVSDLVNKIKSKGGK